MPCSRWGHWSTSQAVGAASLRGPMGARSQRTKARPSLPGSLPDSTVTAAQAQRRGPPGSYQGVARNSGREPHGASERGGRNGDVNPRTGRREMRPWTGRGQGWDGMRRPSGSRAQRMQRWTASSCSSEPARAQLHSTAHSRILLHSSSSCSIHRVTDCLPTRRPCDAAQNSLSCLLGQAFGQVFTRGEKKK